MPQNAQTTRSHFIELTRIVRTAIILDSMFEWLEELVRIGDPLWELWMHQVAENERAIDNLKKHIDLGVEFDWLSAVDIEPQEGKATP